MWRILAKYNEEQQKNKEINNIELEFKKEVKKDENNTELKKEDFIEKIKIVKKKLIQNTIQEDLLNAMKNNYLEITTYNDYINSSNEIKDIYEDIYRKIFDIKNEQKELKKEYEDLLYIINV